MNNSIKREVKQYEISPLIQNIHTEISFAVCYLSKFPEYDIKSSATTNCEKNIQRAVSNLYSGLYSHEKKVLLNMRICKEVMKVVNTIVTQHVNNVSLDMRIDSIPNEALHIESISLKYLLLPRKQFMNALKSFNEIKTNQNSINEFEDEIHFVYQFYAFAIVRSIQLFLYLLKQYQNNKVIYNEDVCKKIVGIFKRGLEQNDLSNIPLCLNVLRSLTNYERDENATYNAISTYLSCSPILYTTSNANRYHAYADKTRHQYDSDIQQFKLLDKSKVIV